MFSNVLMVCTGNICRSPTAEFLFRRLPRIGASQVSSAGLAALSGQPMSADSIQSLARIGIDGTSHRARQLTHAMLHAADLVIAMEHAQVEAIVAMAPETRGKVFLLTRWQGSADIPDPYRRSAEIHEQTCQLIDAAVASWASYI